MMMMNWWCCSRQAGRYQKSLELAERAKDIEETELGGRPDRMADIYQMCANAMDEVCLRDFHFQFVDASPNGDYKWDRKSVV